MDWKLRDLSDLGRGLIGVETEESVVRLKVCWDFRSMADLCLRDKYVRESSWDGGKGKLGKYFGIPQHVVLLCRQA